MADETIATLETINLSEFADPAFEAIRISRASGGDRDRLAAIKNELRREEDRGWCRIHLMTDDLAVVEWFDQFVLTIRDQSLVTSIPPPHTEGV